MSRIWARVLIWKKDDFFHKYRSRNNIYFFYEERTININTIIVKKLFSFSENINLTFNKIFSFPQNIKRRKWTI